MQVTTCNLEDRKSQVDYKVLSFRPVLNPLLSYSLELLGFITAELNINYYSFWQVVLKVQYVSNQDCAPLHRTIAGVRQES